MQTKKIIGFLSGILIIQPYLLAESMHGTNEPQQHQTNVAEVLKMQKRLYKKGIFRSAIPAPPDDMLQRAIKGEMEGQYQLGGWFYEYIVYEEQCVQISESWLKMAALQGLAEAQWQLGHLYRNYRNNEQLAKSWFKKSITSFEKRTDSTAYKFLCSIYYEGTGTEVNIEKAKEYALKYVTRCQQEKTQPRWIDLEPEIRKYVLEQTKK